MHSRLQQLKVSGSGVISVILKLFSMILASSTFCAAWSASTPPRQVVTTYLHPPYLLTSGFTRQTHLVFLTILLTQT